MHHIRTKNNEKKTTTTKKQLGCVFVGGSTNIFNVRLTYYKRIVNATNGFFRPPPLPYTPPFIFRPPLVCLSHTSIEHCSVMSAHTDITLSSCHCHCYSLSRPRCGTFGCYLLWWNPWQAQVSLPWATGWQQGGGGKGVCLRGCILL